MDWLINDALPVAACVFIVWIFPFSFLDKVLNWDAAVKQASSSWLPGGAALLYPAMAVELLTPPMIVFGFYDGIAAFVLAGYCAVTAPCSLLFWYQLVKNTSILLFSFFTVNTLSCPDFFPE